MRVQQQTSLATKTQDSVRQKFSVAIQSDGYKKLINNTLGDPNRAKRFVASISSAVAINPALQECDAGTILSAALLGESLNLSPSPQLGQYYLVPYKDTKNNRVVAQMQIGYRGFVQLAIRSGYYRKLNVISIKEGELVKFDPLTEDISVNLIDDDNVREETPTMGYYAMFEYENGFRKAMYWSKEKMLRHASRYSKAFDRDAYEKIQRGEVPQNEMWKFSSFWYKDFDGMAYKTMLRQLISKWGIMSTDMQAALAGDQAVQTVVNNEIVNTEYVDNPQENSVNPPVILRSNDGSSTEASEIVSEDVEASEDPLA